MMMDAMVVIPTMLSNGWPRTKSLTRLAQSTEPEDTITVCHAQLNLNVTIAIQTKDALHKIIIKSIILMSMDKSKEKKI